MTGLLSVSEVAARTGQSEKLVRTAIREGTCPSVRWGRRVLVPAKALERLLAGEDGRDQGEVDDNSNGPAE